MVEFVSYDGKWPCLCGGTLTVRIDGEEVAFPHCLRSGGYAGFDADWEEVVTDGPWAVRLPDEYRELEAEVAKLANANVPWGCCGGCI